VLIASSNGPRSEEGVRKGPAWAANGGRILIVDRSRVPRGRIGFTPSIYYVDT
jgi:hypothetical protein